MSVPEDWHSRGECEEEERGKDGNASHLVLLKNVLAGGNLRTQGSHNAEHCQPAVGNLGDGAGEPMNHHMGQQTHNIGNRPHSKKPHTSLSV